jgi:hypothetical protein
VRSQTSIMTASDLQTEEESVSEIFCISESTHQTYARFEAVKLVPSPERAICFRGTYCLHLQGERLYKVWYWQKQS